MNEYDATKHFAPLCQQLYTEFMGSRHPFVHIIVIIYLINTYRVFSIERPRRLFQTWHGGPGVSLNQQFIWARHF